jgi:hypothetical protein
MTKTYRNIQTPTADATPTLQNLPVADERRLVSRNRKRLLVVRARRGAAAHPVVVRCRAVSLRKRVAVKVRSDRSGGNLVDDLRENAAVRMGGTRPDTTRAPRSCVFARRLLPPRPVVAGHAPPTSERLQRSYTLCPVPKKCQT